MSGYRHRRLRKRKPSGPEWIVKVPHPLTAEQADLIKRRWKEAGREGVALIDSRIEVTRWPR
jgi:hypothetical protein